MNCYKIIYSIDEIAKFFNILRPLGKTEVHFVSLSARNKYLSKEMQKEIALGRTEMFARKVIRHSDLDRFLRVIRTFETVHGSYLTKNRSIIPPECIVCYFNINPSDMIKSYYAFQGEMNKNISFITENVVNGKNIDDNLRFCKKVDITLMNCIQKNSGRNQFLDIDFDINKEDSSLVDTFAKELILNNVLFHIIDTKGGFHVLIDRATLNYNYNDTLKMCNSMALSKYSKGEYEIVRNKNEMIPLPGTIQAGYHVKLLSYDEFKNKY